MDEALEKKNKLLDAIGKRDDDKLPLGSILITRAQISHVISSYHHFYTVDFVNLLLYGLQQEIELISLIKSYPAIAVNSLGDYLQKIQTQSQSYAFIPIYFPHQGSDRFSNYWVAMIIDKKHQLIFYLDPAHRTKISSEKRVQNNSPMIDGLLDAIGKNDEDGKQLGDSYITRGEVKYTVSNEENYYTADFIWILICSFNEEALSQIKAYPAITIERICDYFQQILSQNKNYAFLPISIAYDKNELTMKNHWVALIVDKKQQLIFYLDPAKKTTIVPVQIKDLELTLNYQNAIILNPIDFQRKEKHEGWARHCGVYVIEIFKVFQKSIQNKKHISGSQLPNIDRIKDSISLQTSFSEIPCGEAEAILTIRKEHIKDACKTLGVDLTSEIQNTPSKSSEGFGSYCRLVPEVENLRLALSYKKRIVMNPINFQKNERQDLACHWGVLAVEMFNIFAEHIQDNICISGELLPHEDIEEKDNVSLGVALNDICWENEESISAIRAKHINDACKIFKIPPIVPPKESNWGKLKTVGIAILGLGGLGVISFMANRAGFFASGTTPSPAVPPPPNTPTIPPTSNVISSATNAMSYLSKLNAMGKRLDF